VFGNVLEAISTKKYWGYLTTTLHWNAFLTVFMLKVHLLPHLLIPLHLLRTMSRGGKTAI
jgi:hypothetical protein